MTHEFARGQSKTDALGENDWRFRAIFNRTFQFMGLLTPDGILLEANDTALNFGGLAREDVVGRPFWEARWWAVSPETQSVLRAAIAEAAAGKFVRYEVEMLGANDMRATFDFSLTPIKDDKGAVILVIPEGRDITERRVAEDELTRSEMLYRTLAQNLPQTAIFLVDRNLRYMIVEGTLLESPDYPTYGRETTREMMEGKPVQEVDLPESQQWLIPYYEAALKGTGSVFERKMGERFVSVQVLPVRNEDDEIFAGIALIQDITIRKQAEEALREARDRLEVRVKERTADLKAANEELSTFTYIVSHDLRAPLVNLKGFASELRSSVGIIDTGVAPILSDLPEHQTSELLRAIQKDIPEALQFIDSSVSRMDHLTSAVLRLSRLGRRVLHPEPLDMNQLVQTVANSLAHQIREQRANVTIRPLPDVTADRTSIEQIIANLLSNAVLYLRPDCPGKIEIWGECDDDKVTYHIRDNGRGIAEGDSNKVFEPFRRAGASDVPGEGMGLAYVQTLIRRHGGRIWFMSEPGIGSTFSFTVATDFTKERGND